MNIARLKLTLSVKDPKAGKDDRIASASALLGSKGIKALEVIKKFDDHVEDLGYPVGTPLILKVLANINPKTGKADGYKLQFTTPSVSHIVKTKLGIESFSKKPGKEFVKEVSSEFVKEVAKEKFVKQYDHEIEGNCRLVAGSLKSMGIKIKD